MQKRPRPISSPVLTKQALSMKDLSYGQKITPKNFAFAGTKRAIPNEQDQLSRSGSQSEHRIHFVLPARGVISCQIQIIEVILSLSIPKEII